MSEGSARSFAPLPAAATVAVLLFMVAASTYRLTPVDVPWHLATGRWILEHGFMTTNTFSWTHPDHPLYQQYPLFQVPLTLVVDGLGWSAGSLWFGLLWTGALLAWMRWAGPPSEVHRWPLLWLGAAVGLQRHAVQRPEAQTILLLGLLLVALDRWRTHGDRRGLLAAVGIQWLMVNTHQLFPLGLVVQFGLLAQLLAARHPLGRWVGLDPDDAERPVGPMLATFVASVAVLALSPLGPLVYLVPIQTVSTVLEHGQASIGGNKPAELEAVTTDPIATVVALALGGWFLLTTVRSRGRWRLEEVGTGLLGIVMTLAAVRGISFLGVTTAAAALRMARRTPPLLPERSLVHPVAALLAASLAGLIGSALLRSEPALFRVQPGLGQAHGGWGASLCRALHDDPPPGEPLNLGWAAGNPLIGCAFPVRRPFVDPRFEAYPRDFLADGIRATDDPELLARLLDTWRPGFVVVELRLASAQDRLAELVEQGWGVTHLDEAFAVAVPPGPWLEQHRLTDFRYRGAPGDPPVVEAQQRVYHAGLLQRLGVGDPEPSLRAARLVDHPAVADDLRDFGFATE
jgi:hypothetical protein